MLSVSVEDNRVRFGDRFGVSFQRTLRIPDDGKVYPLPPGLNTFPVRRVEDYASRVPQAWREQGGVFIPMYQREALWLYFEAAEWKPNAVKVGVGRINAVSGEAWEAGLHADPQDYLVCPNQPWLDGINAGEGFIRQFVAMPLGQGYTIEGQLTGKEEFGGIQMLVYEPRPGRFPDEPPPRKEHYGDLETHFMSSPMQFESMGLGAGGKMEQKIYPDPYGADTWDPKNYGELFVHIVNSEQYRELTGEEPPQTPVSAKTYTEYNLPWFALYDEKERDLAASEKLAGVGSIAKKDKEKGVETLEDEEVEIEPGQVKKVGKRGTRDQ